MSNGYSAVLLSCGLHRLQTHRGFRAACLLYSVAQVAMMRSILLLKPDNKHNLRHLFSRDFTFTKRQIGLILCIVGSVGTVGILAIDWLRQGNPGGGIGPAQALGLMTMIVMAIVGATLIPLGDDPV